MEGNHLEEMTVEIKNNKIIQSTENDQLKLWDFETK